MSQTSQTRNSAPPSTLAFINVAHPSGLKRHSTEIRKHVMRDIGRARRRPKAKEIPKIQNKDPAITKVGQLRSTAVQIRLSPQLQPEKQAARHLTRLVAGYSPLDETNLHSFLYPMKMEETQLQLIRNMDSKVSQPRRRPLYAICFALMTTDLDAFYLILASSFIADENYVTTQGAFSTPSQKSSMIALAYYNKSIESVKKRILESDALSDDGLLIAVLSFLCYNDKVHNFEQWNIHIAGLERLVALRGGIDELNDGYTRLLTIWQDICGAAALDIVPRFSLPKDVVFHPADYGSLNRSKIFESSLKQLRATSSGFEETVNALDFIAGVSVFINNGATDEKFWDNDIQTARLIICSTHKALTLPRVESENIYPNTLLTQSAIIKEVLRRSLLVFLAYLKARSEFSKAPMELGQHLSNLKILLSLPAFDWSFVPELKLWTIFICSIGLLGEDKKWCGDHIREGVARLNLDGSAGVLKMVKEIIWIEHLVPVEDLRWLCTEIDGTYQR
ncbi:hypothetical protein H072_6589 [Dactylellina haptotyla CBS 200.50]|uniref:Transcription factor domain-containing protein n=1 Tax=Dactylellina haptotyla (strain CBS 200.50) TaxID=1284197 RepID=S8BWE4_DACHA|nr:hypothetical protein H072_6589 [Dactylellina haptotyla CBS 200.50]